MKKRSIMISSALLLAVLLVVGGTMAWFTATSEAVENKFTAGTVAIELWENGSASTGMTKGNVNPGDCFDKVVTVKNTGSKKAMVRVHESTVINGFTPSTEGQTPNIDIVDFTVNENWEYDASTQHFYYKNVLEPDCMTEPILDSQICFDGATMGNEYQGATFTITLEADAIQASNGAPTAEGWKFDPLATP